MGEHIATKRSGYVALSSLLFKTSTKWLLLFSHVGCGLLGQWACFGAAEDPMGAWGSHSSAPLPADTRMTVPNAHSSACWVLLLKVWS